MNIPTISEIQRAYYMTYAQAARMRDKLWALAGTGFCGSNLSSDNCKIMNSIEERLEALGIPCKYSSQIGTDLYIRIPTKAQHNARFWIWWNGTWVKITLKPGCEPVRLFRGGRTDEGWTSETLQYEWMGENILMSYESDGCDCDGRLSRSGTSVCHLSQLKARCDEYTDGLNVPVWVKGESSQRDYTAERAGY